MDEAKIGLGIDAGGSSSRWLLLSSTGAVLGEGRGGPLTGHIFSADEQDEQLDRFVEILAAARAVHPPDALVAGITGLHPGTVAAELFRRAVMETLGLDVQRAVLDNDMHVAFASAFGPGEGVLVYAGTGSVAYHETVTGEIVRAGGYGYLIDDSGAGYWLGHRALRALFRQVDAAGGPSDTPLAGALYARLGSRVWSDIMPVVYGGGRSFVASLAPAIAAAERAGDEVARDILKRAGAELARLAQVVQGRLGAVLPVAFAGGVTRLSPVLTESLETHLGASVRMVEGEPVYAAARLALGLGGKKGV
ncbi:N-acetylglucosamine kinase [soil metagenome]